jgi:hypothetical protein
VAVEVVAPCLARPAAVRHGVLRELAENGGCPRAVIGDLVGADGDDCGRCGSARGLLSRRSVPLSYAVRPVPPDGNCCYAPTFLHGSALAGLFEAQVSRVSVSGDKIAADRRIRHPVAPAIVIPPPCYAYDDEFLVGSGARFSWSTSSGVPEHLGIGRPGRALGRWSPQPLPPGRTGVRAAGRRRVAFAAGGDVWPIPIRPALTAAGGLFAATARRHATPAAGGGAARRSAGRQSLPSTSSAVSHRGRHRCLSARGGTHG